MTCMHAAVTKGTEKQSSGFLGPSYEQDGFLAHTTLRVDRWVHSARTPAIRHCNIFTPSLPHSLASVITIKPLPRSPSTAIRPLTTDRDGGTRSMSKTPHTKRPYSGNQVRKAISVGSGLDRVTWKPMAS